MAGEKTGSTSDKTGGVSLDHDSKSGRYEIKRLHGGGMKASPMEAGPAGTFDKVATKGGRSGEAPVAKRPRASVGVAKSVLTRTTLKKAGGSLIVTVPAPARHALELSEGTEMSVAVEGSRLVLEAVKPAKPAMRVRRPKYTLAELVAGMNLDAPPMEEEQEWMDAPPVGREVW